jgi:hypothetical protein
MLAARALAKFGTNALPALPTLTNSLADPVPDVREAATNAIKQIAPQVLTNAPARPRGS